MQHTTSLALDRYLVALDPRQVPHYRFDVLVLGSGAAGCVAALSAAREGANVALLSKAALQESNTEKAKGGIAAVFGANDSIDLHVADTLRVGCGLAGRDVVEHVVREGPAVIKDLLDMGAEFDRGADGHIELSREGGHTHARVLHARGDQTGREIQHTVIAAVAENSRITSFAHTFAIDLLSDVDGHVYGVLCRTERGDLVAFLASQVVLASGGAGQIYRETTNPEIATADGVAMGFRAGARVRDLEFMQFHPTCLYIAGAARVLISEIVRGAGGVLRDRHGVRFMPSAHPQAELAPRDVVSRAVFERMVATDDTSVYLDLSDIESDPHILFPGISSICRFFGIDIAKDPVPVRPGAHYMVGGIEVDLDGRTSVPNLWAVGECASSGLHGANRMGSNSLLEALALGKSTGLNAARAVSHTASYPILTEVRERSQAPVGVRVNIGDITYSLKSMMWRQMGVERVGAELEDAAHKIEFWTRAVRALAASEERSWELMNMLTVAYLATLGAVTRTESRGVHFRSDYPEARPEWLAHAAWTPVFEDHVIRQIQLERQELPATQPA